MACHCVSSLDPVDVNDVITAVRQLPDIISAIDPLPTTVLKLVIDLLALFVAELFNRLLD